MLLALLEPACLSWLTDSAFFITKLCPLADTGALTDQLEGGGCLS